MTTTAPHATPWLEAAADLRLDPRPLINGRRSTIEDGAVLALTNPRDGSHLTDIVSAGQATVDHAVTLARDAADTSSWARQHPRHRREALMVWADRIDAQAEELALLICLETGKPIHDALYGDLPGVSRAIRWCAEAAVRADGRSPLHGETALAYIHRTPAGVVATVTPWNFPLAAIGYEVAPALSLGNAVIVKPSERAPLSVLRCCELAADAGVPGPALSVVTGGHSTGELLGRHHDIDVLTVIGAEPAGRAYQRFSADSNGKRVWPELGGKSAAVICADVRDLNATADTLTWGITFNQGQMCTGIQRVLAHQDVYEELVAALASRVEVSLPGDPLHADTRLGAMISAEATTRILDVVKDALHDGANLMTGGQTSDIVHGGSYLHPTLLADVPTASHAWEQEAFGPIAMVNAFTELEQGLVMASAPRFGMGLSVWTNDLNTALRIARQARVGTVWVNGFEDDDLTVPAGGTRRSGFGRTKGDAALDKYSDLHTTWISTQDEPI